MKTELRFTDTNAASDSKGRTWGLEGGLFWWLVGGVGVAITVFFVLLVMVNTSLLTAFLAALAPLGLCLAYILGFRHGKPSLPALTSWRRAKTKCSPLSLARSFATGFSKTRHSPRRFRSLSGCASFATPTWP
jgi:hypothetical protein